MWGSGVDGSLAASSNGQFLEDEGLLKLTALAVIEIGLHSQCDFTWIALKSSNIYNLSSLIQVFQPLLQMNLT